MAFREVAQSTFRKYRTKPQSDQDMDLQRLLRAVFPQIASLSNRQHTKQKSGKVHPNSAQHWPTSVYFTSEISAVLKTLPH